MSGTRIAIGIAVLVLLGGCAGSAGDAGPADPATASYPDGFGADGITNVSTAVETHEESLDSSYRISFTLVQSGQRGTTRTTGYVETAPSEERFLRVVNQTAGPSSRALHEFQDGTSAYRYYSEDEEFEYSASERPFRRPVYADRETFEEMLASMTMNATAVRVTNGTERIEYTVTNVSTDRIGSSTADTSGTVVVEADGTIRSMNVTFTQTLSGVERETTFEYDVSTGVDVTVTRPSWVELARNDSAEES